MASIVEREAKLAADRGPVASTLYNRLRAGMPLGADSTQTYFLRLTDPTLVPTAGQLDQPSSYNTRLHPVCHRHLLPIPAWRRCRRRPTRPPRSTSTSCEVKPDGTLGFASTAAGFAQLQDQCRAANLC